MAGRGHACRHRPHPRHTRPTRARDPRPRRASTWRASTPCRTSGRPRQHSVAQPGRRHRWIGGRTVATSRATRRGSLPPNRAHYPVRAPATHATSAGRPRRAPSIIATPRPAPRPGRRQREPAGRRLQSAIAQWQGRRSAGPRVTFIVDVVRKAVLTGCRPPVQRYSSSLHVQRPRRPLSPVQPGAGLDDGPPITARLHESTSVGGIRQDPAPPTFRSEIEARGRDRRAPYPFSRRPRRRADPPFDRSHSTSR